MEMATRNTHKAQGWPAVVAVDALSHNSASILSATPFMAMVFKVGSGNLVMVMHEMIEL